MKPLDRLERSERVVSGWERVRPGGPIADNIRMIGAELEELRKVAAAEPSLAERVAAVSERYGRVALNLKLGLN